MFPDDSELIRRFQGGDPQAFEKLVRKHQRPLFTFLCRLVGNRESAEDLFQDTFVRVLEALPAYVDDGRFVRWLFRIANHLAIDHVRRQQRRHREVLNEEVYLSGAAGKAQSVESDVERLELTRLVERLLLRLPEKQRQVFLLRLQAQLSFKEIADLLDEPLNTVLSHMHYAVTKLRKQLRAVDAG